MKKILLSLSVLALGSAAFSTSAASWVRLTDNSSIPSTGIDAVIAYNTPTKHFVMGTEQSANYRNAIDVTFDDNTIPELPEGTAIVKITPSSDGYSFYVTNGDATGYLTPQEGKKFLNVQDSPAYAAINTTANSNNIVFKGLDEKNELGCTSTFVGGQAVWVFQCMDQGEEIQIYIDEEQLGDTPFEWSASPAAGSMVASFNGVTLTLPEGETTINPNIQLKATLNGQVIDAPQPSDGLNTYLVYAEELTEIGEYQLTIPAGYYTITPASGKAFSSPEMVYNIIIGQRGDWIASPANGAEVTSFKEVLFSFPGSKMVMNYTGATGSPSATFNGKAIAAPTSDISQPLLFRLAENINTPGEIVITIPANYFLVNYGNGSVQNKVMTYTVTIAEPVNIEWSADPENGSTQKTVETITFAFTGATNVALNDEADTSYIVAKLDGKEIEAPTMGRNDLQFSYRNPLAKNGAFTLTLKEGLYNVTLANGKTMPSPEINYSLTLEGNMEQTYTVSPEAGAYDKYPTVTITYDNVKEIEVEDGAVATLKVSSNSYPFTITASDNVVTLTPQEEITTWVSDYTTYTLSVPEGAYYLYYSDETVMQNEAVEITNIKVAKPVAARVQVILEEGTYQSFEDIKVLEFISPVAVSTFDLTKKIRLYSIDEGDSRTEVATYNKTAQSEDKLSWTVLASVETVPDGKYVVVIPENYFTTYNEETKQRLSCGVQEFFYTIDSNGGVDEINRNEDTINVFTITGICVLRNADAAAFNNLPAGLYIVNGKKVIKK